MIHLIPSHQGRPANDPIFALHAEATERKRRGEPIVDASLGVLLDDDGALAILPVDELIRGRTERACEHSAAELTKDN